MSSRRAKVHAPSQIAVFRSALLPWSEFVNLNEVSGDDAAALLRSHVGFNDTLRVAAPGFYERLKSETSSDPDFTVKLYKYFARFAGRPTPLERPLESPSADRPGDAVNDQTPFMTNPTFCVRGRLGFCDVVTVNQKGETDVHESVAEIDPIVREIADVCSVKSFNLPSLGKRLGARTKSEKTALASTVKAMRASQILVCPSREIIFDEPNARRSAIAPVGREAPKLVTDRALTRDVVQVVDLLLRTSARHSYLNSSTRHLEAFRHMFSERYGDRSVPLLEVMSMAGGIGGWLSKGRPMPTVSEARLEFFRRLGERATALGATDVELSSDDLEALSRIDLDEPIAVSERPDHIHVFGHQVKDGIFLSQVRSAPCGVGWSKAAFDSRELWDETTRLARAAYHRTGGVVCADLAYDPGPAVAPHVPHLRALPYQIVLGARPTVDLEHRIFPAELEISLQDGRFRLWSKRLKTEVVPLNFSSHGYQSDASRTYRFLSALSNQNAFASLEFLPPIEFRPRFLPRLWSRSAVLSLRTWKLPLHEIETCLARGRGPDDLPEFARVESKGTSFPVSTRHSLGLRAIHEEAKKVGWVVVTEDPGPTDFHLPLSLTAPRQRSAFRWPQPPKANAAKHAEGWLNVIVICPQILMDELVSHWPSKADSFFYLKLIESGVPQLRVRCRVSRSRLSIVQKNWTRWLSSQVRVRSVERFWFAPFEKEISQYGVVGQSFYEAWSIVDSRDCLLNVRKQRPALEDALAFVFELARAFDMTEEETRDFLFAAKTRRETGALGPELKRNKLILLRKIDLRPLREWRREFFERRSRARLSEAGEVVRDWAATCDLDPDQRHALFRRLVHLHVARRRVDPLAAFESVVYEVADRVLKSSGQIQS